MTGLLLALLFAAAPAGGDEVKPTTIHVQQFRAADEASRKDDLHLIAQDLFVNALAATKKFVFVTDPKDAELRVRASLYHSGAPYTLELFVRSGDEPEVATLLPPNASLESLVLKAAEVVSAKKKLTGFVVKHEGNRVVIARGSEEGIAVGQHFRLTDTGEELKIVRVAPHTAEGEVIGMAAARPAGATAVLPGREGGIQGAVDIVFVIDTTSSMQEEIDGVLENCLRFASRLAAKRIDARYGLVTFREGVVGVKPFTANAEEFKEWIKPLRAGGGGDETPFEGLQQALRLEFRPAAKRVMVLITDEPAYDAIESAEALPGNVASDCDRCVGAFGGCFRFMDASPPPSKDAFATYVTSRGLGGQVMAGLRATKTTVFSVTIGPEVFGADREHGSVPEGGVYQRLASETGGQWYDLEKNQDFSALLEGIGEKIEGMFQQI